MRIALRIIAAVLVFVGVMSACDFQTDPVAARILYRSEGWSLPAIDGGKLSRPVSFPPDLRGWNVNPTSIPNLALRIIIHDPGDTDERVLTFPRQEFGRNGEHRIMPEQVMLLEKGRVYRYDVDGKIVAYTYRLTPVVARKVNGKWKIEGEAACVFLATFVDDRGDGVFRQLISGALSPDLVPQWALGNKKKPA